MNDDEQQVIALAATVQALSIVHEIATQGKFVERRAAAVLQSLINYNPDDAKSAYGGEVSELSHGLTELEKMMTDTINRDIAQYLLSIISVELKLVRQPNMRRILQTEIQQMRDSVGKIKSNQNDNTDHFSENFDNEDDNAESDQNTENDDQTIDVTTALISADMISQFAEIYKQTASQTEPRIMVKGSNEYLQNEQSANQIRALLLAALRSAAFFRQFGGKRVDFMLKRKQYMEIAKRLRAQA